MPLLAAIDSTEGGATSAAPAFAAVAARAAAAAAAAVRRDACITSRLEKRRSLAFSTCVGEMEKKKKTVFFFPSSRVSSLSIFLFSKATFFKGSGRDALRLQHEGLALPRPGLAVHSLVRERIRERIPVSLVNCREKSSKQRIPLSRSPSSISLSSASQNLFDLDLSENLGRPSSSPSSHR